MQLPDGADYPRPNAITGSLWWLGRGDWGCLAPLTAPGDCNIYLLKGADYDVLIDSGGPKSLRHLEKNVRASGSHPERIREIWLTHSHLDHFLGAAPWVARYPSTVCRLSHVGLERLA